jgi:hypothetical protein
MTAHWNIASASGAVLATFHRMSAIVSAADTTG